MNPAHAMSAGKSAGNRPRTQKKEVGIVEQPVRAHVSKMLQSSKFRRRAVAVFACVAVIVALGVARALRLSGVAMTHTELVLDCHYDGHGAHTHNEDCYDANGKLVCPLKERALHTHDDSCYTETRELTCGQEEGDGAHTHTDDCYDEDGNLVCGLEESDGHQHTDECYEVTRELTCGKDEITDEHVHGIGCFKEVTVDDGEAEEEPEAEAQAEVETEAEATDDTTKADDEVAMPKQEFQAELKELDEKGREFTSVVVAVKAPEGAFPEGTTMEATWVEERDLKGVEAKTKAALERESGHEVEIKQYQAVDIVFRDADGKEIEPARKVEVKLTSVLVPETDDPALVHVVDKTKDNQQKDVDAEVLTKVDVVNQDDEDKSKGNEDTLKFKTDEFSPYVICDYVELTAGVITADGARYTVSVTYDEAAGIPEGAKLEASEYAEPGRDWTTYVDQITDELGTEPGYARLFDITIMADGKPVQPKAPVHVRIALDDADGLGDGTQVVHFGKDGLETLDAIVDGGTVSFEASGFSVYAVVDGGDTGGYARLQLHFMNGSTEVAKMIVKNNDTLEDLNDIIYDPGVGTIPNGQIFKGWSTTENYTVDDAENGMDIEAIRKAVANRSLTGGDNFTEVTDVYIYAMLYKNFVVNYLDESGVGIGSDNVFMLTSDTSSPYTVNMTYAPKDDTHNFEGWKVHEGGTNISGYTTGKEYQNGDNITISGNVTFSVNAPEGHWLVFDENGKGATYNAPVFVKSEENTVAPPDPTRFGYTFGGWYTATSGTADDTGYTPVDESTEFTFGSTLSDRTTLHAKWTPVETANYTVLIWKQNVTGDGYDFSESISLNGPTNAYVNSVSQQGTGDSAYARINGKNYTGNMSGGQNYTGYHLKEFDQDVMVTPEGDAVLNVYYDRTQYTLRFYYARSYVAGGTTTTSYNQVGTANNGTFPGMDTNKTYYRNQNGSALTWRYNQLYYYQWAVYTGPVYEAVTTTTGGRTYVQVNCNDEGFLKSGTTNLDTSLTKFVYSDYSFESNGNTWKTVTTDNAENLITQNYKQKVQLGSREINNVQTYVVTDSYSYENYDNATSQNVNMTYYYFDIPVYYGQSLVDVWPVPNTETYNVYNGSGYNTRRWTQPLDAQPDTGIGLPIRPIHQGFWATGNGVSGLYSRVDPEMFVGDSKIANFITYWRFQSAYEVTYRSYFSVLEGETPDVYYHGKGYKLHETFTALTGEPYFEDKKRPTDSKDGWDIGTVTYNGTRYASGSGYVGREDGKNPNTITAYYDRVVQTVIYNDGIYVNGNGNPIQNRKEQQLHTKQVVFGTDISNYNAGGVNYWRPDDTDEYVFEGWYLDTEGKTPYTFSGTMPEHDITVYAKWRQRQYRVFLHPNADTDPSLTWGSENQQMNFRVSYGGKVSTPTGRRSDYEFVGWYTDPNCTPASLFSADTELNKDTVSSNYDKTKDFTDTMDKWGNGATTNADLNRPWITKKLDLYGKWRAKLNGANGIGVVYDANGGTNAPTDQNLYLDQVQATAQAASTAPEGKQFVKWVVQTWDNTQRKYVDTDISVYPGDSFDVLRNNSKVVVTKWKSSDSDNAQTLSVQGDVFSGSGTIVSPHTGFPVIGEATYKVQLRAEYVDKGAGVPTRIDWYGNNETAKTDGADFSVSNSPIMINEAVDVKPATTFTYEGHTFLGWARLDTTDASGNPTNPTLEDQLDGKTMNLTEDDLFLKWDGSKYVATAKTVGATNGNTVSKVAADEHEPHHAMVAVWKKNTYDVTIVKRVEGITTNEAFTIGYDFDDTSLTDGEVSLTHEGTKTLTTKVPYGTVITLSETANGYDKAFAAVRTTDAAGTAVSSAVPVAAESGSDSAFKVVGATTITVTNTRQKGTLKVSKVTTPAGIADSKAFKVSVRNSAGKYLQSTSDISFGDDPQWFDVSVATALTIANLPTDTYTVVEDTDQAAVDGYRFDGVTYEPNAGGTAVVTKDAETELTVTNSYTKLANATVTKVLDDPYPNGSESFTFTAKLMEGDADVTSRYLGEDATFTLTPTGDPKTASKVLENLPVGAVLTVTETEDAKYTTTIRVSGQDSQDGELTIAEDASSNTVEFTNTRKTSVVDFKKVAENGTTVLSGATFELKIKDGGTSGSGDPTYVAYPNGTIKIGTDARSLVNGDYELTEKSAPDGYIVLTNKVYFTVSDEGVTVTSTPKLPGGDTDVATAEAGISNGSKGTVQVKNVPGKPLPVTGGVGTTLYTLVGTMLVALGAVALVRRRRTLV